MTVTVRYIVTDAGVTSDFYRDALGFTVDMAMGPDFAIVSRDGLRLMLNRPGAGGAGQPSDAGDAPAPGGWNRIQLAVDDVGAEVERLVAAGARCRTSPVQGNGGVQAVVEDPAGNPIELISA
ncbi:VOC family protein [Iamia sp. SCSIO 61187]|uniref:VOC family protein n=1 Tax=Iamia sp. SCSIO 61187 TaxID=2722752 RepID=UPI001C636588|nr:VOC family protein [Iamia sp. SCSIO 61187]QYG91263.1 VOC family protein [Iamia sp. SCSIO 61187]